ncbi:hypothetical protein GCM10012275_43560 [Longimycelium tulufanense]|uniref:CAAX prenyl protease 2/Lysostaphin resistance protein A-like domain-containing protein n=1 Tax=Longimycelium tulufanense TaxID=907463 RepID=A0A8J3CHP5_9PSEU|nr:CPBP family intramembrane glutamic endopeptidase [Longimycelium tulufanense]GGM68354.1 hypothetical protein GCM10012275_43560 [Longimycelium tulufanense]
MSNGTDVRPRRTTIAGAVVVVAVGCLAGFVAAVPPVATAPTRTVWVAAGLAVCTVVAFGARSVSAVRLTVFVDVVFAGFALGAHSGLNPAVTTVVVCVAPILVLRAVAGRWPDLRPALPWLRWGRWGVDSLGLAAVTILAGAAALIVWANTDGPSPSEYLADLGARLWWVAVLGVLGFSLVNPIWEEALFRGVLQTELGVVFGAWPAVAMQAVAFGLAHLHGFPSGWWGMLMAGVWGAALGVLRLRTNGVAIPYLVHVCANVTIGVLAVALLG